MNYIIFDLEWNQPFDERATVTEPVYLTGEIIEIGAVKLDDSFRLVDGLKLYIKPQYYQKLHRQIASLTHIRDKDLQEQGLSFSEAMAKFRAWCGEEYTYVTWSTTDLPMLVDNMILHGMDVGELPCYCDLQRIFGREIMRESRRHSLNEALEYLSEKGETAHDALNDARNTALVCKHLDLEDYIGEYISKVFSERPNGRLYESRQAVFEDEGLLAFSCPWCGAPAKCRPWLQVGARGWMAMATCEEGDEFWVQLILKKTPQGQYYAQRLFFEMSDDLWELYQDQRELQTV